MAELRLTEQQLAVVTNRDGQLLVSAAAGSGKTKVLVDRLLGMVCDPLDPQNLDRFLIITYTKAAASELRAKIAAALSERLAAEPNNKHLLRQMNRLYSAKISTVHSFCADLLRTNAALAQLDPEFRVAEEMECSILRSKVLSRILETEYGRIRENPGFRMLTDSLGYGRDDRALEQIVFNTYDTMQCQADPEAWAARCRRQQTEDCDPADTVWGAYLTQTARRAAEQLLPQIYEAIYLASEHEKLEKAYLPTLDVLADMLRSTVSATCWQEFSEINKRKIPAFKAVRGFEDPDLQERIKLVRDRVKNTLSRVISPFASDPQQVTEDLARSSAVVVALLDLVEQFAKEFSREKAKRRIVDFSDLEHRALALLSKREVAHAVSGQFREVMVDEYQDTNAVQDAIFRAVSGGGEHLFMVGDVKQSIYRFRLADPSIFLEKYHRFADLTVPEQGIARKILLTKNFRSRPQVLAAVNHVFRTVMSEQVGDLEYTEEEALEPGAVFAPLPQPLVELHCINTGKEELAPGKTDAEAEFVANRIATMLREAMQISDGPDRTRSVTPGDIVILMRSPKSTAASFVRALTRRGIPAQTDQSGDILQTTEVQTLLSLLQLVDNPHQDIPLVAVLNSPVTRISPSLLAELRAADRKSDLYTAMRNYAPQNAEIADFLMKLIDLREMSEYLPLDQLIDTVVQRFELQELFGAMPSGAQRLGNLQSFVEYAAAYSSGSYRLLMDFLTHISGLLEQGRAITARSGGSDSAVRILSIHKSKGLEYPVVFLCDLSRKFNLSDLTRPVLLDPELGTGSDVVDTELLVRYPSLGKQAIAAKKRSESLSEELRVLYVGMTRPKDMLIMTYSSRYLNTELGRIAANTMYPADPIAAADAKNPGQWILMAAMCRPEAEELFDNSTRPDCVRYVDGEKWVIRYHNAFSETLSQPVVLGRSSSGQTAVQTNWDPAAFGYVYPHLNAVGLPAKLTATQMKGRMLDAEVSEDAPIPRTFSFEPPGKGLNAAQRGSATHLAMQFLDFERCMTDGVAAELDRLCEEAFLTREQADAVRSDEIERLLHSELGERVRTAAISRETKFSILVDAKRCIPDAPEGERIMIQGVADCILRDQDGLTVLDYKTDRISSGGEMQRSQQYLEQIRTYCMAVEELYGQRPVSCLLYFFATGQCVEMIDRI